MPDPSEPPMATDPYRSHKFRMKWDGRYVAGFAKVSSLTRSTEVIPHRPGGDPTIARRLPGQSHFGPITLERGVSHDLAFQQWANEVWDYHNSAVDDQPGSNGHQVVSLKDFRKDIVLEVYNEAGQKVLAYTIYRCWPSEFVALPELDAAAVAIATLVLQNEGWERDTAAPSPEAPGPPLPAS